MFGTFTQSQNTKTGHSYCVHTYIHTHILQEAATRLNESELSSACPASKQYPHKRRTTRVRDNHCQWSVMTPVNLAYYSRILEHKYTQPRPSQPRLALGLPHPFETHAVKDEHSIQGSPSTPKQQQHGQTEQNESKQIQSCF